MAFFKKKETAEDSFDLPPPPPPPMEKDDFELPQMPDQKQFGLGNDFSEDQQLRPLEPLSMPSLSSQPPLAQKQAPVFPAPQKPQLWQAPMAMPENIFPKSQSRPEPLPPFMPERNAPPTQSLPQSQIFVEVTRYKNLLKDLNKVKKDLKDSDKEVMDIFGDSNQEEKILSHLSDTFTEVSQKLTELEQSLFSRE